MRHIFIFIIIFLSFYTVHAQKKDTLQVLFATNQYDLSDDARNYLKEIVQQGKIKPGQKIMLAGYADYIGSDYANSLLSSERAKSVLNFLLPLGFSKSDINFKGMGRIKHASGNGENGYPDDRKVLIIFPHAANKIDITNVKANETITLKNIYFEPGYDSILPESKPELEVLYNMMHDNSKVTIQIEGHICCRMSTDGPDQPYGSSTLSESRAKAIYDYLVAKGINASRMKYKGMGFSHPVINPEMDENDREQNRRVEIRILTK